MIEKCILLGELTGDDMSFDDENRTMYKNGIPFFKEKGIDNFWPLFFENPSEYKKKLYSAILKNK